MPEKQPTEGRVVLVMKSREPGAPPEATAPCGCAFHPRPEPHWHQCEFEQRSAEVMAGVLEAADGDGGMVAMIAAIERVRVLLYQTGMTK